MEEVPGFAVAPGTDVRSLVLAQGIKGRAYFVFEQDGPLPLEEVSKLARRVEVWVDASPKDASDALDLAVAGAHGVVAWFGRVPAHQLEEISDVVNPGFLLACTDNDLPAAALLARQLECPLVIDGSSQAPPDLAVWRLSRSEPGKFHLQQIAELVADAQDDNESAWSDGTAALAPNTDGALDGKHPGIAPINKVDAVD